MDAQRPVVCIGHAIVDAVTAASDELIASFGLTKGTMTLVDGEQAAGLYAAAGSTTEVSGGSAANTAAGLANLGVPVAFVGKVRDDQLGNAFAHDIRAAGVTYDVPPAPSGPATGRCLVLVSADAERTMTTFLGAGDLLDGDDIDPTLIGRASMVYLEGYLAGLPTGNRAIGRALAAASASGVPVSLSLSDPSWVELHRDDLDRLVDRVSLLFGNEQEVTVLRQTADLDSALATLTRRCPTVVVTRGAGGSVVAQGDNRFPVPAYRPAQVVDTNGAGDAYAAGYLYGLSRGFPPSRCAELGSVTAAEIVSHFGPRPLSFLPELIAAAGLAG